MTKQELILNFIGQYQKFGESVVECFTSEMSYHFANILQQRFGFRQSNIVYFPNEEHFACEIDKRIYDITGDITDCGCEWKLFDLYKRWDAIERERVIKKHIYKVPDGVRICCMCEHWYYDDWGNDMCDIDNKPIDFNGPCMKGE